VYIHYSKRFATLFTPFVGKEVRKDTIKYVLRKK
jgi:hypothetical protein